MSRSLVVLVAANLALAGCEKVAQLAGAPNRDVATVTVNIPSTILVGDTVKAVAVAKSADGRPPLGDTTVTWHSSDPGAVSVDARGRVTGDVVGRQATISATVQKKTGSVVVTIGDDQRLGYALADQPSVPGPYVPDANYRFNSSGGTIEVTRASAGVYSVRFAGLGRGSGGRDNVLVTAYAAPAGAFCKLAGWQSTASDVTADVRCFSVAGTPTDDRFTILLSGARPYVNPSRFGFVLTPDFAGAITSAAMDTFATSRNSATGNVNVGHNATGDYSVQWPGLERVGGSPATGGPETEQITAVGSGPERCRIGAVAASAAGLGLACTTTGGVSADTRFSVIWFTRGRPAPTYRFGYAFLDQQNSTVDYTPNTSFWRNNSGGSITARETATGQYRVVFEGLGKAVGATETVLVSAVGGADRICTTNSWSNTGANDLAVTIACFNAAGSPVNTQFNVLVVQ